MHMLFAERSDLCKKSMIQETRAGSAAGEKTPPKDHVASEALAFPQVKDGDQ